MFKKGLATVVILLFIGLAVSPSIYAEKDKDPVPNLDCSEDLYWNNPEPGSTLVGDITVENIGEPGSLLNWEVESYPNWGLWKFCPENGTGLEQWNFVTISVEVIAPDEIEDDLVGHVKIINVDDPDDFCLAEAWIEITPPPDPISYFGLIRDLVITDTIVTFHLFIGFNSYFPRILPIVNRNVELPNNYEGHLGEHFVWATFYY